MTFKTKQIKLKQSKYRPRSADELRKLAKDIINNDVFTSNHLHGHERQHLATVFLPLAMFSPMQKREMWQQKPFMFYANRGQRNELHGINGVPMLDNVAWLDKTDTLKLEKLMNKYDEKYKDAIETIDTTRI